MTAAIFIYTLVAAVFGIGVIIALGGYGAALLDIAVRKTLDLDEWDKEDEGDGGDVGDVEDIETHDIEDCEATLVSTATYSSRRHASPTSTPSSTTSSPPSSPPIFILKAPK